MWLIVEKKGRIVNYYYELTEKQAIARAKKVKGKMIKEKD